MECLADQSSYIPGLTKVLPGEPLARDPANTHPPNKDSIPFLESLLAGFNAHKDLPGTFELHDAIYELLLFTREENSQGVQAKMAELERLLSDFSHHPSAPEIGKLLPGHAVRAGPDLKDVVESIPDLPLREDPAEALALYLEQQDGIRDLLESRIQDLLFRLDRLNTVNSILTASVVVLFFVALMGWFAALDVMHVPVSSSPGPSTAGQQDQAGSSGTQSEQNK